MRIAEFLEILDRVKKCPFRGHVLTLNQLQTMVCVFQGANSPTKLASAAGISTAAATGAADALAEIGALFRAGSTIDRRKIELLLSAPAEAWLREVFQEAKKPELVEA